MEDKFCPVCKHLGQCNILKLFQINLTEAVYLCTKEKCTYPEGYKCILVKRNLFEQEPSRKSKKKHLEATAELDQFLLDICNDVGIDNTENLHEEVNKTTLQETAINEENELSSQTILAELDKDTFTNVPTIETLPLKTYSRKCKLKSNRKFAYSQLSTAALMKTIISEEKQINIDYINANNEEILADNIGKIDITVKDVCKNVFQLLMHKKIPISDTKLKNIMEDISGKDLIGTNTVYQDENVCVKVYDNICDLPVEYQQKIAEKSTENFEFKLIPAEHLYDHLEKSLDSIEPEIVLRKCRRNKQFQIEKQLAQLNDDEVIYTSFPNVEDDSNDNSIKNELCENKPKPVVAVIAKDHMNKTNRILQIIDYRFKNRPDLKCNLPIK